MPQTDRAGGPAGTAAGGGPSAAASPSLPATQPPDPDRGRWPHTSEERDAARLLLLQEITAALSEAGDTASVVEVICGTAREWLEADSALVFGPGPDPDAFALLGAGGVHRELRERYRQVQVPPAASDLLLARTTVFAGTAAEWAAQYPPLAPPPAEGHATYLVAPLLVQGRPVGMVAMAWRGEREFPLAERSFLETVTAHSAQALDRAQLYDAERRARREAERNAERIRAQQELSASLSAVPDAGAVRRLVVEHVQAALDARQVTLLRYDERTGRLQPMTAAAPTQPPDGARTPSIPLEAPLPESEVVRTRRPVVVEDGAERDRRYPLLATTDPTALRAFAHVPLLLENRVLGVLAAGWDVDRVVGTDDRDLLVAVGNQCAQALDRAWLYDDAQRVARTLQESLVPPAPPQIPGLQVGVRYRPVGERTEVGGDFYDVFRITPGRWGVVIGDVSGKGVAAASMTALVRYTIRATAKRENSPAEVLAVLNEALLEDTAGERFCTVAYLEVEPNPGSAHVTVAVAGHPLPRLLHPDGTSRELGRPGMALGMLPLPAVHNDVVDLGPGDLLALYTDGVAEAGGLDVLEPEAGDLTAGDLVTGVLHRCASAGAGAQDVADALEQAALDRQAGAPRDDLAVVALRVPAAADADAGGISAAMTMTLECDPRSVGMARRAAVAFLAEHGLDHLADTVRLLTSEIVTNAVVHACSRVGFRMSAIGDRLRVEARDASLARPIRRDLNLEAVDGRGLLLLDRLSTAWDVRRTAEGKTVWFELELPPPARRESPSG